jgi:DnaK suppressor protein
MKPQKQRPFRQLLLAARSRVASQAGHMAQAMQDDITPPADVSSAPVHLADVATIAPDADARVLATQRDLLDQIDAALARLDDKTFGKCQSCGRDVEQERLEAIPYAAHCAACAERGANSISPDDVQED